MSRTLHINHPGDGAWIMERCGGVFNDKIDHVVALHRDGKLCGGLVYTGFLGGSIQMHAAGDETNWPNRDFLWLIFDYAFNQLGVCKVIGLVAATNIRALDVDLRLGWRIEAVIRRALWGGEDLLVLGMVKEDCRWLKWTPRYVKANYTKPKSEAA